MDWISVTITQYNSNYPEILSHYASPTGYDFLKVTVLFFAVLGTLGMAGGLRFKLVEKTKELLENVKLITICALGILFPDSAQIQSVESTPSPSDSIEALPVDP